MAKRKWTQKDIDDLRDMYPDSSWDALELYFNSNKQTIITIASKNGIERLKTANSNYSDDEIEIIKNGFTSGLTDEEIQRLIPWRTVGSVKTKRQKIGLIDSNKWTDEEERVLKELYNTMPSEDIEKYLPRKSRNAIVSHAICMGLTGYRPYSYYSEAEYEFIKNNYTSMTDEEMAQILGRCKESVKNKRNKLGCHRVLPHDTKYESIDVYVRRHNKDWKINSMKNSNYKCVVSGDRFDDIHHLVSQNTIIESTLKALGYTENNFDINKLSDDEKLLFMDTFYNEQNKYPLGVCLRKDIHKMFHDIYGYGNNTKEQFTEFLNIYYPEVNIA